ncbi:HAD family hydrolase [Zhouia sp. PK063]|uniref:HAD family hydrolase n=1 Tax=Zhouia sp. PK063 TaxID=3373602 RepID=UPI0037AC4E93
MEINTKDIQVIGFDADDTLWVNETYFRDTEAAFAQLLSGYETTNKIDQELFHTEIKNLELYGYGIKGFVLSMVECALDLSNGNVDAATIHKILNLGKDMLTKPVEILDGVEKTLNYLKDNYRLIVLTKGDLLDQERKLEKSGLSTYFHHVEVLSDKKEENYKQLLTHLQIDPAHFVMVGNSLKSDILPLINIGAQAIHVPFHTTWAHEEVQTTENQKATYKTISSLADLISIF